MNDIAWELTYSVEADVGVTFAWGFMTDVTNWVDPPAQFELDGPFATGSEGTTRMPGHDPLRWRIRDVQIGKSYIVDTHLDRATLSFEWRFDAVSDRRTRLTQRIVLAGDNAAAYEGQVEAGFGANLPSGMKKIAEAMAEASMKWNSSSGGRSEMKRHVSVTLFTLLAAVPLFAQAPKGWLLRADRSASASDPDAAGAIKFVTMGSGFHATNPQAAVFWNPANTVSGSYALKGTFTLVRPSGHPNYYGLVFGGSNLEASGQSYLYFTVAQDGTWLIKRRDGDASTRDVAGRTPHDAVKRPDASGRSTNALEVRVTADKIDYLVNATLVHSTPKTGLTAKTDGIYGIRVNHQLEVHIDGLAVAKS